LFDQLHPSSKVSFLRYSRMMAKPERVVLVGIRSQGFQADDRSDKGKEGCGDAGSRGEGLENRSKLTQPSWGEWVCFTLLGESYVRTKQYAYLGRSFTGGGGKLRSTHKRPCRKERAS